MMPDATLFLDIFCFLVSVIASWIGAYQSGVYRERRRWELRAWEEEKQSWRR